MFKKAKWIWINDLNKSDEYGHFKANFNYSSGKVILSISCDGDYNVFLNNKLVSFGQYPDYPHYKIYQEADITDYCSSSKENTVEIIVWYYGIDYSSTYYPSTPGLIFEINNEDSVLLSSNKNILSKVHDHFKSYRNKKVTTQLGLGFSYDARDNFHELSESYEVIKDVKLYPRPVKDLIIEERTPFKIIKQADKCLIIDLMDQYIGFLDLDFISSIEQEIKITYGEDLVDGSVNHLIGDRDFSVTYYAKKGVNKFINYLFRFGGRYLQIYFEKEIDVNYIGLTPITYPVTLKNDIKLTGLRKKIYDVSIKTLNNCMQEHYGDCPWREQALYTMDSRNQMLSGYYAFEGCDYQRSNLVLISKGQRESGLLDICFPSKIEVSIPSFSLVYPISVFEYIKYSKDETILDEVFDVCTRIIEAFEQRIDNNGLISHFDLPYWNFYEWTDGSDSYNELIGVKGDVESKNVYSLILNSFFLYSLRYYKKLCKLRGVDYFFNDKKMIKAINDMFYDDKVGLYKLNNLDNKYSILGNSMAILADVPTLNQKEEIIDKMLNGKLLIESTISMKIFYYDALLSVSSKYKDYVLEDIDKTYSYMLEKGATTFWETIKGKDDFDGAGSLCHGWSAIAVYYYHTLLK